jgi:hypothetical protein
MLPDTSCLSMVAGRRANLLVATYKQKTVTVDPPSIGQLNEASFAAHAELTPNSPSASRACASAVERAIQLSWLRANASMREARLGSRRNEHPQAASSLSSAFASFKSRVSNPSVNQP